MVRLSRREVLSQLLRDAGRTARPFLGSRLEQAQRAWGDDDEPCERAEPGPRAAAASATASTDRLGELGLELGVPVSPAELAEHARLGLVLTVDSTEPQREQDERAAVTTNTALLLALSEPLLSGSELAPSPGVLRVESRGQGEWSLRHEAGASLDAHTAYPVQGGQGATLAVSRELVLPREWSQELDALGLDGDGRNAWGRLRARLAEEQGRELYVESNGVISHRWLGIPEDRSGNMPLECELRANDAYVPGLEPLAHSRAEELSEKCSRWRLLLQLSPDPQLGWSWGSDQRRLYVWMSAEDMRSGSFEGAVIVFR